jgi:hypothetical protein
MGQVCRRTARQAGAVRPASELLRAAPDPRATATRPERRRAGEAGSGGENAARRRQAHRNTEGDLIPRKVIRSSAPLPSYA